jgi:hypothetical protein
MVFKKKLHQSVKRKQPSKASLTSTIINTKKEKDGVLSSTGFQAFGVNINSETVRLCSLYISKNPECPPNVDNEVWTRVNMVARDRGESIMNIDDDGANLAASLHMVVKYLYKANVITFARAEKMEEVVEKLRDLPPSHQSPSPKNTKKRKSTNFQKNGYDSESSQLDEESEYGDDEPQVQVITDDDDEEGMVVESDDDSQSSHNNTGKHENQAVDDVICPDDETDQDHYDPPSDCYTHGYNPTGDICNDLPRLIVKGSGKVYYGVGKKPHSKTDVAKKVKGKELGPKAGDVGFFKMTRMDPETLIRDGTKSVKLNWDYCDFTSGNYSFFIIVTLLI